MADYDSLEEARFAYIKYAVTFLVGFIGFSVPFFLLAFQPEFIMTTRQVIDGALYLTFFGLLMVESIPWRYPLVLRRVGLLKSSMREAKAAALEYEEQLDNTAEFVGGER